MNPLPAEQSPYAGDDYYSQHYASYYEVRQWAMSKGDFASKSRLPAWVFVAFDRAHPSRPYHKDSIPHGTMAGYVNKGCRCHKCCDAGARTYKARKTGGAA